MSQSKLVAIARTLRSPFLFGGWTDASICVLLADSGSVPNLDSEAFCRIVMTTPLILMAASLLGLIIAPQAK